MEIQTTIIKKIKGKLGFGYRSVEIQTCCAPEQSTGDGKSDEMINAERKKAGSEGASDGEANDRINT